MVKEPLFRKRIFMGSFRRFFKKEKTGDEIGMEIVVSLTAHINMIFNDEKEIARKIAVIEIETGKIINKQQFLKDILIFRCILLYKLFFGENQELSGDLVNKFILYALKNVLNEQSESISFAWISEEIAEYIETEKLKCEDIEEFEMSQEYLTEIVVKKMQSIVYDCTGGRFGGDQYDAVMELLMTIMLMDKKVFHNEGRM